jgi:uncharacterized protein (DUF2237 family)
MNNPQLNVNGQPLQLCGLDPLTGFFRDGYTNTSEEDFGSHTVCAVVSQEFLEQQKKSGNDLITPRPEFQFPGLKPGDRWAVCASRWQQSFEEGAACGVVLDATNEAALAFVDEIVLRAHAVDVPDDLSILDN